MRKQPAWVWAVIAAGAVAQACLWGMVGAAWVRTPAAAGTSPSPAVKSTPTREEFRFRVLGKTRDQVIEAVGKPDRSSDPDDDNCWVYRRATVDPLTGRVDPTTFLWFTRSGVVDRVTN